jgi:hypothetical protein
MQLFSATDLAIKLAAQRGTLSVEERQGRYGAFWAISDEHGLIEVQLTAADAEDRINHLNEARG